MFVQHGERLGFLYLVELQKLCCSYERVSCLRAIVQGWDIRNFEVSCLRVHVSICE